MEPLYRIHAVAEAVGVSGPLLRAWERRYGLLHPRRTPAGYRVYSEADVALLRRVKELLAQGLSIAEAAALAPQLREELAPVPAAGPGPRDAGARARRWASALVECASTFDQHRANAVLDEALLTLTALEAFQRVVVPAQVEVGERWARGEVTAAGEHLVTNAIRARLAATLGGRGGLGARHVVCASLPDDDHDLGLLGAALRFREAGWRVTWLGARAPADGLGRLVARRRPDLVALGAQLDRGEAQLTESLSAAVSALPPGTQVVVGGAAARAHPTAVQAAGARLLEGPDDWRAVLSGARSDPS